MPKTKPKPKPGMKKGTGAPVGKKKGYSTVLKSAAIRNKPRPVAAPTSKPRSSGSTPSGVGIGFNAMVRGGVGNAILKATGGGRKRR